MNMNKRISAKTVNGYGYVNMMIGMNMAGLMDEIVNYRPSYCLCFSYRVMFTKHTSVYMEAYCVLLCNI